MKSLLFHSNPAYLKLLNSNECNFYSLLENNLLNSANGSINNVMVTFKNKKTDQLESALLPKSDFLNLVYRKKCFNNKDISKIFQKNNFKKTIETTNFETPKTSSDCDKVLDDWLSNPFTPFLCKVSDSISKAKKAKKFRRNKISNDPRKLRALDQIIKTGNIYFTNVSFAKRTYLDNLCTNLDNSKNFCKTYLSKDIWNAVANGEQPRYKLEYICQRILKKSKISERDLKACALKLNKTKSICKTMASKTFPAIFPKNNCLDISDALTQSRLITNYQDCPGNIANESFVNIHRIQMHFKERKYTSTKEGCVFQTMSSYAKLNIDNDKIESWPLEICYEDPVLKKEVCSPYIPGDNKDDRLSESFIVAKILKRIIGLDQSTSCQIVDSTDYKPNRLKFKVGCFIVKDISQCTSRFCERKIFVNLNQVKKLKYKGESLFDYFPNSYIGETKAQTSIMKNGLKLNYTRIRNLTQMLAFFERGKNRILHGVGCVEDLLPRHFKRSAMNNCRPTAFIIDGFQTRNSNSLLTTRLAIEDVHGPRLINWSLIFNSVKSYQRLHPLRTWTLQGIRK
jgi:hypothetical protein